MSNDLCGLVVWPQAGSVLATHLHIQRGEPLLHIVAAFVVVENGMMAGRCAGQPAYSDFARMMSAANPDLLGHRSAATGTTLQLRPADVCPPLPISYILDYCIQSTVRFWPRDGIYFSPRAFCSNQACRRRPAQGLRPGYILREVPRLGLVQTDLWSLFPPSICNQLCNLYLTGGNHG